MKRHLSVLMFYARNSFYKVLAALLLLAAAEGGLFYVVWRRMEKQYLAGEIRAVTLERIVEKAQLDIVFVLAAFVLVGVLHFSNGRSKSGRPEYTLYRLSITPRSAFLWLTLYHCCCFVLFWAAQAAVAVGLGLWFVKTADPAMVTNQSLFLAFYRSEFLHGVIPLQDTQIWLSNIMFFLTLGILSAYQVSRFGNGSDRAMSVYHVAFFGMLWLHVDWKGFVLELILFIGTLLVVGRQFFAKGEWNLDV